MVTRSWLHRYPNPDESTGVDNGRMLQEHPLPGSEPIVVQVSRWDRLKDPLGVLQGVADHVADHLGAHLVLAS